MISIDRIRNVALLGHNGCGKTTLAEALLSTAGAITRIGRVEDGTTVCDSDAEEHKRGQSLSLSVAPFEWRGHRINLIDTPGYADFVSEVEAALDVVDLAIVVVSAVDGIEPQTRVAWRLAAQRSLPRMVFINKLDRPNASFDKTVQQLRAAFGDGFELLELPLGAEATFYGVADLLSESAFVYDSGHRESGALPNDVVDIEHTEHDHLVEDIVAGDDALLERFLEGDIPSVEELERTLADELEHDLAFPVLCGSATTAVGVDRLADFIVEIGPNPTQRPARKVLANDSEVQVVPDPNGQPLAVVFKTEADPYVGHLSLFKVLSGTIRPDDRLINSRNGSEERLHALMRPFGGQQKPTDVLIAGDIGVVAKLASTRTGDTLAPRGTPVRVPISPRRPPAYRVAITARTQADDDKLAAALHRLLDEDPSLSVERNDETHQTLLGGAGDAQVQVTLERLQRKFGITVDLSDMRVAYRETIARPVKAEGRHKKQSGGHGQFGVATIEVEPLPRGTGFEFVDQIVGGAIPRQFIPAVEHGISDAMGAGGPNGFPVVDLRVRCVDGKFHAVDSSEMSFKLAGSLALREAFATAGSVVLEPVSRVDVFVPEESQGDVLGDINARRGRVLGTDSLDDGQVCIHASVPAAELVRYALDLRSITRGQGQFVAEHDHYDFLPPNLMPKARNGH